MQTPKNPSIFTSIGASLYYIAVSVCLTIFNKMLFALTDPIHPTVLLFCQSVTTILLLSTIAACNIISLPSSRFMTMSIPLMKTYAPLYFTQLAMLLTSLLALKLTSLLMYNTLRRSSIVFVVILHSIQTHTRPTSFTLAAAFIVTFGAIYAARTDLAFDFVGYTLALIANVVTSLYLILVKPVRDKLGFTNIQLVYLNAVANIPILFIMILIIQPSVTHLLHAFRASFTSLFLFLASCMLSCIINHAIFVNTTVNDAVAQSIAAQLKDVILLTASVAFIDDPSKRGHGNIQGAMTGFIGSVVYAIGKLVNHLKISEPSSIVPPVPHVQRALTSEGNGKDLEDEKMLR